MIPSQTWQKGCGGTDGSSPLNRLSSSNFCTMKRGTHSEYLSQYFGQNFRFFVVLRHP